MKKPSKQAILSIGVIIFFTVITLILFKFQPEPEPKAKVTPPIIVSVERMKLSNIQPFATYSGRLEPHKKSEYSFEIQGTLKHKHVKPGDNVKKNQNLLTLVEHELHEDYLEIAKQNYEIQKSQSSKLEILNTKGLVSDDEYEKSIQKTLDLKTKFLKTREDFNKTTIKSLFSGTINSIDINVGDTTTLNKVILTQINDTFLDLNIEVRGDAIENLEIGKKIQVKSKNNEVFGKIVSFQTSPDFKSYTHLIKVRIEKNNLRAGMIAYAEIPLPKYVDVFSTSVSSVITEDGSKYIFKIQNEEIVKKIPIEVVSRYKNRYIIQGDIKINDLIVSRDVASLANGQKVKIKMSND
jgi:multidrug efflux system membrane fusion protein|tara:strand:+ start:15 stop:1070 length:1056 start_codon:yes stop_codon:yes gene_type:complete